MPAKCTKQQGTVLFIMLVILVIGFAAILVNSLTSSRVKNLRQANTTAALAQAKAALIGYAITYGDTHSGQVHGYLPCPDYVGGNPEGSAEPVCGAQDVSAIGRLPWATLDVSDLRDGNGECLWYAVSGTYKNNPPTGLMNWDTNGQFQVYAADGTLLASQVVAVIIAPGAPQSGQDRSGSGAPVCGGNYTVANYLDNDTVHSINNSDVATGKFIQGTSGGNVNDQMVFITRDDIWNAVLNRADFQPRNPANTAPNPNNPLMNLTKQVALCLAYYGHYNNTGYGIGGGWSAGTSNKSLPWPAPLALGTNQLSDYAVNANYADSASLYAGRVPYNVSTSKSTSSNTLGSNLMTSTGSCASWPSSLDPWWNNWKDHLFYGLSSKFRPSGSDHAQSCGSCVEINSTSHIYSAVVMFAGPRLSALSQARTDKSVVTDYLETPNGTNFSGANGNEDYSTGAASSTFNDTLCYLSESLSVTCP